MRGDGINTTRNDIGLGGNRNFKLHGFLVSEDVGNLSGTEKAERSWGADPARDPL